MHTDERHRWAARAGRVGAALSLALIVGATLVPTTGSSSTPFLCLTCNTYSTVDFVLNVLLFVPFGLATELSGFKRSRTIAAILALTIAIELLQFAVVSGRDSSASDLLANSLGGGIGLVLGSRWRQLLLPRGTHAAVLASCNLLGWTAARVLSAWMLEPVLPASDWIGMIAPPRAFASRFEGEVTQARIYGVDVPVSPFTLSARPTRGFPVTVEASVTTGKATCCLASVVSAFGSRGRELLVLGQHGNDAWLRVRMRASEAKLRAPALQLSDAFAGTAGSTVALEGTIDRDELVLSFASATIEREVTLSLTAGLGWVLLSPIDIGLDGFSSLITSALTGLVTLFAGYLAGRGRAERSAALQLPLLGIALFMPSVLMPVANPAVSELAGAAFGTALGLMLGGRTVSR